MVLGSVPSSDGDAELLRFSEEPSAATSDVDDDDGASGLTATGSNGWYATPRELKTQSV